MWHAVTTLDADPAKIIEVWKHYLDQEGHTISRDHFLTNMDEKIKDKDFLGDMEGLLRAGITYDIEQAYAFCRKEILEKIQD